VGRVYDGDWVVSAVIDDRAERFGNEVALTTARGDLTFGDLRERAARVAGGLIELGVEPGDRVATMLDPTVDYVAAWFGAVWAGAVDVPVNTAFKGDFLEHVLVESEAEVLVVDARWLDRLASVRAPALRQLVVVGEGPAEVGLPCARLDELLDGDPVGRVPRAEDDLVYVMYTSGTTGPAKGAMHVNRSALWNAKAWIDIMQLTASDVAYSMFPLFHVTARSAVVTASLWGGTRAVLREGFSASGFLDDVRATGATWFGYMGAVIQLLWKQPERDDDAVNDLRVAFGAAAPPDIAERFERRFGVELLEVYGSTELGPATAPRPGRVKRGTMGRPCEHVLVEIHDAAGVPCPTGTSGEIVARPAVPFGIFQGYWRQPEASLEAFRHLWFHTGDGGYLDDEGYLVFTDRLKDSLRRRGENISSFEVERAVQRHPDVLEAAAYAVPSELTEDEVMVAVVASDGVALDPRAVLAFCAETMPRFAVPRYLRVMEQLPKTPSQRVQKFLLRLQGVTPDAVDRVALGIEVRRD
jgi:crotonobetaine/carnitine-CoA ligase